MTEYFSNVQEGALTTDATVETFIADGAVELWAPVILATAGTGETNPRVDDVASAGSALVIGVAVGPKRSSGKAADAAGDRVAVCTKGMCKCKVNGNSVNIALGDILQTSGTAGIAIKLGTWAEKKVFARALKATTADGDIIPVFVNGGAS